MRRVVIPSSRKATCQGAGAGRGVGGMSVGDAVMRGPEPCGKGGGKDWATGSLGKVSHGDDDVHLPVRTSVLGANTRYKEELHCFFIIFVFVFVFVILRILARADQKQGGGGKKSSLPDLGGYKEYS